MPSPSTPWSAQGSSRSDKHIVAPLSDRETTERDSASAPPSYTEFIAPTFPRTSSRPSATGHPERPTASAPPRSPRLGIGAIVGICLGLGLLVLSSLLVIDTPTEHTPVHHATATATKASTTTAQPAPAKQGIGVTFGKVTERTSDSTLKISSPFGRTNTVHTDDKTEIMVLIATRPTDIDLGAPVAVYGTKRSDGSIDATVITGISVGAP